VTTTPSYKGHRYPVEIINHCVWLYFRFPLSLREVEELMLARGVAVSYETIQRWCAKFGQAYANQLRRRRPRPGDKWHLDEVFVRINGRLRYLWRAVDQDGNVLDVLLQVTPQRGGGQAILPQAAQGPAVCAARAGDRQAGQLPGRPPRVHVVGGAPAVAVSEQPR
jgi:transposase-like protein